MGLEARSGRVYYYRKVREGRRVRSVYGGSGPLALAMAALDAEGRAKRARGLPAPDPFPASLVAQVEAHGAEVARAARDCLEARGYRRHRRGEWRRARVSEGKAKPVQTCALDIPAHRLLSTGMADAAVRAMAQDLAKNGAEPAKVEKRIMEDMEAIRVGLEGPSPTALERLLVERVVVCYAAITTLECRSTHHPANGHEAPARHMDRLHRRLNEACRALAAVQRMRLPSSPVFVGGQHVHVGEGGP